jgi:UDP-N-acetylmuramoyl-tripeptide--D-alanyl-D-alanine ligase
MIEVKNDVSAWSRVSIKGAAIDSRKILPGNLFVPLKGEKTDGHHFVEKAFEQGAAAALWQEDIPHPPEGKPVIVVKDVLKALQELAKAYRNELSLKVVAITGSNGKTTTKDITAAVLGKTYRVQKTEGNLNNHIGLPLTVLSLKENTEIAILEMGMSGRGEISLLTDIAKPDVAIITNIGEAHLLDLGSREAIADAKFEITEGLKEGGLFIYPGNEPLLVERASRLKQARLKTFGQSPDHDLYLLDYNLEERGSTFIVSAYPDETLFLPVAGKHNLMNALAALLAAIECSVPFSDIKAGLKSVKLSNMRMEWRKGPKGSAILNDAYNSSPTALRAVISMIESMDEKREKILVLGDMLELGEDEQIFHRKIGREISPDKIKYVFTYGRLGKRIAEGAAEHFPKERVFSFQDQEELIAALFEKISGNEIIAVKASRGMELEKVVEALAAQE